MDSNKEYLLELSGITQAFPGVIALDNVSFKVRRGRVHALIGENGAGKSTLIKILAGIYTHYQGDIVFDGGRFSAKTPFEAQKLGISVVHQELKLSETLTVAENIFLGRWIVKNGLVDWTEMRARSKKMIDDLGMDIDVDEIVENLTVAKKQIVEVCKAINYDCKLLIMDEPSATLTDRELDVLFSIIKRLSDKGITIIYISHKMDEIFKICEDTTVLRDGKHIHTGSLAELTRPEIINLMVGREFGMEYPKDIIEIGETILEVKNMTREGVFSNISFDLRKGEVFGISGLVGSGRTEVIRAIIGVDKITGGEIIYKGKKIRNKNIREAIDRGFGLVPEDRKKQGLVQILPVKENITMVNIEKIIRGGIVSPRLERQESNKYVDMLGIALASIDTEVQYLSGGNQQKVVIAKWLMEDSEVLILDEPTRGIDVGAKTEIYKLINELVKLGKSIILISSELPEVIAMSDRVMVMHDGRCMGILDREDISQQDIMSLCV